MPNYTTTRIDGEVDIRLEREGPGSWEPKTVFQIFEHTVSKYGDRPALHFKKVPQGGDAASTEWTIHTWAQYYDLCRQFAKSLISLKFAPHRAINIIGFNSPEWLIANCGAIAAGGVAVGIYTTNNADACKYITEHSEAEVVVVENRKQLEKYLQISQDLPHLKALVVWDGNGDGMTAKVPIYTWSDFIKLGKNVEEKELQARIDAQRPGHCCTLIYTSGTTGPPKAVMISHDNLTWTVRNFVEALWFNLTEEDRSVSYLPLSHVAAQMLDVHCPLYTGAKIYFAQPDALRGSLGVTLKEVRPTYFFGVPRVWEKIYEKMQEIGKSTTGVKKALASWAKAKGLEKNKRMQYGGGGGAPIGFGCAHALILSKVKAALGLDQTKVCITSAAPIAVEVLEYFSCLDIPIYELFGQSECTGPHTSNFAYAWKIGSIGRDIPGVKSKKADMQEFCMYGRHVMMGYMKMEDKTRETVDPEGWLHSGDIAEQDKDGFWSITGRIKELIITAGGENIPPVLIENEVKAALPAVANCMVIGDKRKFLTVLLTLKTTVDSETGVPTNLLTKDAEDTSKALGSSATTVEQVMTCPKWKKHLDEGIKKANSKSTSSAQTVQKWAILPRDFSEKGDELTPTLKLKRSVVAAKYKDVIDQLYAGL